MDNENSESLLNLQGEKNNRYKLKCCCVILSHSLFMLGGFGLAVLLYRRGDLDCLDDGSF